MVFYYLLLSVIAAVLVLTMVLVRPIADTITFYEKLFVAIVFIASCLFGISLAIYPNWWRTKSHQINHASKVKEGKIKRSFQGHHPDCNTFKSHIIFIKNKPRCAGCLGLALGSLVSILLMALYLFLPYRLPIATSYILLMLGIFALLLVYGEIILNKRHTLLHIIINSLLVLSFLVITISVVEITKGPVYGILTILICFLWLDTRIHLSNQQHKNICASCTKSCKTY
jgi:hypothetical protein